jgi:dTDP-4-amino-4,6-dideoxygalactose transaminase
VRINVTKSFLPPIEEYQNQIKRIWETKWLTNNGPLLVELEEKLRNYLNIKNITVVNNGTIAIQLAIKALELKGEVITTPFSYCATTTSLLWENLEPVFVDIQKHDLNIDANLIEAAITPKTSAILATHVYGRPCDVEKIEEIAKKHKLKVIYDAAHAFGVDYKGKSLLSYGDVSTCSFHATKVFHTIEGGSVVCNDTEVFEQIKLMKSFGHVLDEYYVAGINGKNSEFHAAMGLVNLNHLADIISGRKTIFEKYSRELNFGILEKPKSNNSEELVYNYAYYPIVLPNEETTLRIIDKLNEADIFPRRYFYPSLNKLKYLNTYQSCPVSEDISLRVLSLPLYPDLDIENQERIIEIVNKNL